MSNATIEDQMTITQGGSRDVNPMTGPTQTYSVLGEPEIKSTLWGPKRYRREGKRERKQRLSVGLRRRDVKLPCHRSQRSMITHTHTRTREIEKMKKVLIEIGGEGMCDKT